MKAPDLNPTKALTKNEEIPALVRCCRQLGLDDDFEPETSIQTILDEAGLGEEVYTYLKNSDSEDARKIARTYRSLTAEQKEVVTIDHIIMVHKADHIKVWGAISEEVLRVKGEAATMIAAISSPDVMKAVADFAALPNNHADRKLLLQTVKVAPVPSNQLNRYTIIQKNDTRIQTNITVPTLEDIVREVDQIPSKVLAHVSSRKD